MKSMSVHPTRSAIYARVSSERQAQENTIASQIQSLRTRIAEEGLTLDEELCFTDDGYSGSTLVRPALERLRDQAAAGAIDRLYVHSPDRLARRYAYQALLVDELQHCGVELVFLNRPLGKGPEDDLLLQVQGIVAEYERAKILERSRRGKLHAARRGRVSVMAHGPYGYHYVSKGIAGGDARYEVCLAEAKVVQDMFRWVACERLSISQVARRLSEQNILSPRGRMTWDRSTVWGILRNPAYKGNAAYGKRQIVPRLPRQRAQRNGSEQPRRPVSWHRTGPEEWTSIPVLIIVEESLFEAVQEQLRENKLRHRLSTEGAKYLLQGLVVCQGCGYAMCGFRNAGRVYYRCVGNIVHRLTKKRVCHNRSVRGDKTGSCDLGRRVGSAVGTETGYRGVRTTPEHRQRFEGGAEPPQAADANESRPTSDQHADRRLQRRADREVGVRAAHSRCPRALGKAQGGDAKPGPVARTNVGDA